MKNVAVFFGGKSVEHDISIITAQQVLQNLSKQYNILPIYITPDGEWFIGGNLDDAKTFLDFKRNVIKPKRVSLDMGRPVLLTENNGRFKPYQKIDVALLCNHGRFGEDGCLQGVLECCQIPYTSCKVMSSACTMDKAITKRILKSYKIDNVKFLEVYSGEFKKSKFKTLQNIKDKLSFPLIIKPANLGSSVGISICENQEQLQTQIEEAFNFDDKILVEEFIKNAREFCCAVIKMNNSCITSQVQEVKKSKIYSFKDKYLTRTNKNDTIIENALENKMLKMSICTYKALECDGVVRIDFLYDEENKKLYVNEVNTIPGSLAFNLFNVPFRDELDLLISEAISTYEHKSKHIYKFSSEALEDFCKMSSVTKYTK